MLFMDGTTAAASTIDFSSYISALTSSITPAQVLIVLVLRCGLVPHFLF